MSLSKPESDVGPSVSEAGERDRLLGEVQYPYHYMFVLCWDVSGFKTQKLKRQFVSTVSLVMRYGASELKLLDLRNANDYTGYAVYADAKRVWLVARIRNYIMWPFDQIVTATIKSRDAPMQWRDVKNDDGVIVKDGLPVVVKMHLTMYGTKLFSMDVHPDKSVNFERVLRAQMKSDDPYKRADLKQYSMLGDPTMTDYFADDYEYSPWHIENILYYWSCCKRNEWRVSKIINNKRKCIDI